MKILSTHRENSESYGRITCVWIASLTLTMDVTGTQALIRHQEGDSLDP